MDIGLQAARLAGRMLSSVHAGDDKLAFRKLGADASATLAVTSPDFADGGELPRWATADWAAEKPGAVVRPPAIQWAHVPPGTRSIAVVCEDPDAPFSQPFVHRLVYGIPPSASRLDGDVAHSSGASREGKNSKLEVGYAGAAPPLGHGMHRYHFQVFALDRDIDLPSGAGRDALLQAMDGHVIGFGETLGTYERV